MVYCNEVRFSYIVRNFSKRFLVLTDISALFIGVMDVKKCEAHREN